MIPDVGRCDLTTCVGVYPLVDTSEAVGDVPPAASEHPGAGVGVRRARDRRATVVADVAAGALAGRGVAAIAERLGIDTWAAAGAVAAGLLMIVARAWPARHSEGGSARSPR